MTLRVLVVTGTFPPDHSGSGLRIKSTYDLMERSGVSYQVVTHAPRIEVRSDPGSETVRVPANLSTGRLAWRALRILWHRRRSVDLVHVVGTDRLMFLFCWLAWIFRKPLITEIVASPPDGKSAAPGPGEMIRRLGKLPFYRATGVVAMNRRIAEHYVSAGTPSERVFLRTNPCALALREEPCEGKTGWNAALDEMETRYRHLMFGRMRRLKGHSHGLRILDELTDDHGLVLAGPILDDEDRRYLDHLADEVDRLGLRHRVLVLPGYITDPRRLLASADTLWMLSEREGFPNVVLEALWVGTGVVVGEWLGLHHPPYDLGAGCVVVGTDSAKSAGRIESWLNTRPSRDAVAEHARRAFDPVSHAEATHDFLRRCRG